MSSLEYSSHRPTITFKHYFLNWQACRISKNRTYVSPALQSDNNMQSLHCQPIWTLNNGLLYSVQNWWRIVPSVQIRSRASAAALSTVLRTTTLSYGNMRFSGTCPAETPQPIKMKFCTIHYVGELTRYAENGVIGWLGAAPQIGEI